MNLRDLRYLVALAEHRHFGRAAEASFVSQPTLSTQLRKLEEQLDVQLVERNSRQVLLTAVGQQVVARARAILREADAIRDLAREARQPEAGLLTLGVFPTLGPYWLPHAVPLIRARFPKLTLHLVEQRSEQLVELLDQGRLDAAVLAEPILHPGLSHRTLFDEAFVLAVSLDHPLAAASSIRSSELKGRDLLLLEDGHCMREQALAVCSLTGAVEADAFRATSLETLRQMVAVNGGLTLLPKLAVLPPVPVHSGLRLLPFADQGPSRRLALCWRSTSARHAFMEKLAVLWEAPVALQAALPGPTA
ncbi:MAG: LysR substrate-binding domain-containing protein [Xanthomonadales bacterium]|jgi:LysR family hydrogen peroxide-inducible transcriptional activator|nr:LysR substrate-binding domain-containing protein [Xanthomonadales bacterium]